MKKNCGTGLVLAKSPGTSPNSTGTGTGPEFRSGPSKNDNFDSVIKTQTSLPPKLAVTI